MTSWSFDSEAETGTWETVKSPVDVTLRAVTSTANGPCAVGNKGYVIGRSETEGWGVVIENGPAAAENSLYTVAATDDGKRVWFAGGNGALGYYDLEKHERRDFSEPKGMDATITSLTVSGKRSTEKLLLADDSGNVLPGEMKSDGVTMDWSHISQPAGDSALNALCSSQQGVGYGVDSNANVWQTTSDEGGSASVSTTRATVSTPRPPTAGASSSAVGTAGSTSRRTSRCGPRSTWGTSRSRRSTSTATR
ncbi:hypothetical protein [Halospeciosus flavus]|uniref:hypothetical protein n=1 Tax=Halospeciosus flavus TaxID=3032283 RepID=UPI0036206F98